MRPVHAAFAAAFLASAVSSRAGDLSGRVLHERRPVIGARVVAAPYESPYAIAAREAKGTPAPAPIVAATTGADGAFRLTLPPTAPAVAVRVEFGGLGTQNIDGVFEAADSEDLGEVALTPAETLSGRVVDAAGRPVAGALVKQGRDGRSTTTNANGLFHLDDIARRTGPLGFAGPAPNLSVSAAGHLSAVAVARLSGPPVTVKLQAAGPAISGTVRSAEGRPAEGAVVRYVNAELAGRWSQTDARGAFRLDGVPPVQGRLQALGRDGSVADVAVSPGAAPGVITLARAATIEGRVTQVDTGKALPGVRIAARASGHTAVTRTSADGRFRLAGLPKGLFEVTFDEKQHVWLERRGVELAGGETKRMDVALQPGATLVGRVTDDKGQPVMSARGRLAPPSESRIEMMLRTMEGRGGRDAFVSKADGTFQATRLAAGANQRLTVTHADYERRVVPGVDLAIGPKPATVNVVLGSGFSISGVVKDSEGRPVAGTAVRISRQASMTAGRGGNVANFVMADSPRPATETDYAGRFSFRGLSAGDYDLGATRSGYANASRPAVKVGGDEADVTADITLQTGASIAGRVLTPTGEPVGGYNVMLRPASAGGGAMGMAMGGMNAQTAPDGSYQIEGLKAGDAYDVFLMGGGEMNFAPRKRAVVAPAQDVDIEVAGRGRIAGRVVNAVTGAPVTEFEAAFAPAQMRGGMRVVVRGGPDSDRGRTPFSSADGAFSFDNVPAGNWDVTVWAKTFQDARSGGISVAAGETKTVEVRAAPGLSIRGRVVDGRSGRGLPEASVNARDTGDQGGMVFFAGLGDGPLGAVTDADGRFEIEGKGPGAYSVTARHPSFSEGSAQIKLEDKDGITPDIVLSAGSTMGGVVTSPEGAPIPGAQVSLSGGAGGGGLMMMGGGEGTLTDAMGRFRFEHLAAGRYRVGASLRTQSAPIVDVVLNNNEIREDVRLSLNAGATVRGVVAGLPDAERGGVMISAQGPEEYFANGRTGTDGSFEFTGVPAGSLRLRATAGDFLSGTTRTALRDVAVAPGETQVQTEIVFDDGISITGTVTRGGQPVAGANVSAFQQATGRQASGRTDDSGSFRVAGLEKGRVTVFAFVPTLSTSASESVDLTGDATVNIVMPIGKLAGTVIDSGTGLPLANASVEMSRVATTPGGPRAVLRSDTDTSGRFVFDDLETQEYRMTTRRSGYDFDARTVTPSEAGLDVQVDLRRGEGLAIEARDGIMGFGLRGLMVRVQQGDQEIFTGPVSLDGEGRGEIPGLRAGVYTITAMAAEYAPARYVNVQAPATQLRILLTPGGTVEFRTADSFLVEGPKNARLTRADGQPVLMGGFGFGPGPGGQISINRPVQRYENLPPGAYRITFDDGVTKAFEIAEGGLALISLP